MFSRSRKVCFDKTTARAKVSKCQTLALCTIRGRPSIERADKEASKLLMLSFGPEITLRNLHATSSSSHISRSTSEKGKFILDIIIIIRELKPFSLCHKRSESAELMTKNCSHERCHSFGSFWHSRYSAGNRDNKKTGGRRNENISNHSAALTVVRVVKFSRVLFVAYVSLIRSSDRALATVFNRSSSPGQTETKVLLTEEQRNLKRETFPLTAAQEAQNMIFRLCAAQNLFMTFFSMNEKLVCW